MEYVYSTQSLEIDDLDYDVMPGGSCEPVLHVPAIRVIIIIGLAIYSTSAQ
jgi:hypothetical protein